MNKGDRVTRILIADDHVIFREGLKNMLSGREEFRVVGEAGDGSEAMVLIGKLQPDILLLDLAMPRVDGMEVLRKLAESGSKVRTILLSGAVDGEQISRVFELGARGLVLKDSTTALLFKSIRAVMDGQYWIGQQGVVNLVQALKRYTQSARKPVPRNYGLTAREMEVLKLVVNGYSNNEIAGQLSISRETVKHHVTNIFDKLGVYNRLELTLFAFHHGLAEK